MDRRRIQATMLPSPQSLLQEAIIVSFLLPFLSMLFV